MEIRLNSTCPNCGEEIELTAEIDKSMFPEDEGSSVNNSNNYANVRSKLKPIGSVDVYRFTSDDIKQFIIQKARQYVPNVNIEVVPRYCEKKRRSKAEPHKSYASLRIAFSTHVLEKKGDYGFFEKIAESAGNVRVVNDIFYNIINLYKYDRNQLSKWTKDYKSLEYLEEEFGMTEAYINDLKEYSIPQRITDANNKQWIIFSAAAENVIKDMLTEVKTNSLPGKMQIVDIYPISKDIVEFLVYMHPKTMDLKENSHVRQILTGEEKPKK